MFVIIALGETLIVAAGIVTGASWSSNLLAVAVLAVAITCGLWWSYFPRAKPILDQGLESVHGAEQTRMARDVFSFFHFPMLCGVITYAFVVEEIMAHPGEPLPFVGRVTLAAVLILFVGGMAVAIWRATQYLLVSRIILTAGMAISILTMSEITGQYTLVIAFAGIIATVVVEQRAENLVDTQPRK